MNVRQLIAATLLSSVAWGTQAAVYSFACISHNAAASCQDGEAGLSVSVGAASGNQVDFTFTNSSLMGSAITEIYFDDGTLLGIASVLDSGSGVTFSQVGSSNPANLPGAANVTPAFVATQGFVVDTGSGGPTKGVENKLDGSTQEFVTIRFNLINGKTFNDTLAALNGPLGDGNDLRIGVHVRSFANGQSESFMAAVPEPQSLVFSLVGLGLMGAAAAFARRPRG